MAALPCAAGNSGVFRISLTGIVSSGLLLAFAGLANARSYPGMPTVISQPMVEAAQVVLDLPADNLVLDWHHNADFVMSFYWRPAWSSGMPPQGPPRFDVRECIPGLPYARGCPPPGLLEHGYFPAPAPVRLYGIDYRLCIFSGNTCDSTPQPDRYLSPVTRNTFTNARLEAARWRGEEVSWAVQACSVYTNPALPKAQSFIRPPCVWSASRRLDWQAKRLPAPQNAGMADISVPDLWGVLFDWSEDNRADGYNLCIARQRSELENNCTNGDPNLPASSSVIYADRVGDPPERILGSPHAGTGSSGDVFFWKVGACNAMLPVDVRCSYTGILQGRWP
ncbi:MAG: hypothetical protein KDG50_14260 [Chromatiales bacterium]|nr:hypothetical protein [Chromatiales bacterium]